MKKIFAFSLFLLSISASAQDRLFTYTYQSNVLNRGQKELEVWSTFASGRTDFYKAFNHRLEFEVGLGGNVQTSFYLNYGYSKALETENGVQTLSNGSSYGFSNEWKLKLADPVVDVLGSAIYLEFSLGTDETELEGKLILDKQIGKSLHALNLVGEYEIETTFEPAGNQIDVVSEGEYKLEFNYGYSYKWNKNLAFGVEVMNQNTISNGNWEYSVISAGPTLSYNFQGFWVNLTCMPQLTNLKTGNLSFMIHRSCKTEYYFPMFFSKANVLVLLLLAGLPSCVSTKPKAPLDPVQQGRMLYVRNCGSCHNLYAPSTFTSKDWKPILDRMQTPARIDDAQKALIAAYLDANCKK